MKEKKLTKKEKSVLNKPIYWVTKKQRFKNNLILEKYKSEIINNILDKNSLLSRLLQQQKEEIKK